MKLKLIAKGKQAIAMNAPYAYLNSGDWSQIIGKINISNEYKIVSFILFLNLKFNTNLLKIYKATEKIKVANTK